MTDSPNLTPQQIQALTPPSVRKNPRHLNASRPVISNEEYLRRKASDQKRDAAILSEQKKIQVGKAAEEWSTRVGRTFAKADTSDPRILDRVNRLENKRGLHKTSLIFFSKHSGSGKAQPVSEPIPTPEGFKKMGDIKVGDEVFGSQGKPTKVEAVYHQGLRPIYKITFDDNTWVLSDKDHLWAVTKDGSQLTETTEQLESYLEAGAELRVQLAKPVHYPDSNRKLTPAESVARIIESPAVTEDVEAFNILIAPLSDRWAALHEFMNAAEYETLDSGIIDLKSPCKRATIITLVNSLGGTATRGEGRKLLLNLPFHPVTGAVNDLFVGTKRITKIEASHAELAVCIQVAAEDSLYLTRSYIVTHNTWGAYSYLNRAVMSGAVNPGQILYDREGTLLTRIASSGYKRAEMMDELLNSRYRMYFIDDVGLGMMANEQTRHGIWHELIDHIYSNQLTLIITTAREVNSRGLGSWVGDRAYDRIMSLVGGDGIIDPGAVNRRVGVLEQEENIYQGK